MQTKISRIIAFCLLLVALTSCAPRISPEDERREALSQVSMLVDRYGEYSSPALRSYLSYLSGRLLSGLPEKWRPKYDYSFVVLDTSEPLAYSAGSGIIVFSRGLVTSLGAEAELAFALAHEIAHQQLGHPRLLIENYRNGSSSEREKKMELEADRQAAGIVALAGYDPRYAVTALVNLYRRAGRVAGASTHPELRERIAALKAAIRDSGWQPPGTINRRAFVELQMELRRAG